MPVVSRIRPRPFRLPLAADLSWGKASRLGELHHLLLELELDDGSIGRAEVPIRPTIYGETLAGALAALEYLEPDLLGVEVDDAGRFDAVLAALPFNYALKGGLDLALWGARAASRGLHLHALLPLPARERVQVSYILGLAVEEEMIRDATAAYEQGVRVFKLKVGRDLEAELRLAAGLMERLPGVAFYADANQTLNEADAEVVLSGLLELGFIYVEEPLPIERVRERNALRSRGILPLIADDSVLTPGDLERELILDTFDILNLKPARSGFSRSLEMLALARQAGRVAMVGSQACSSLGAYHAALLAFQAGVDAPSELAFHLKAEDSFFSFPAFHEGFLYWQDLVGAGLFDEAAFRRYETA